ncbi:MAG: PIN domain-containing protein [Acetobacterium sp.]|nr:PIN domain-containing protein [Acetobacterium sp.]
MKKIAVILDTNIAHSPDSNCNFDQFHIFEYDNTVGFIERHDLTDSVDVFIPEIVLDEITEHRKNKLHSSLSVITNLAEQFASTNICNVSILDSKEFSIDDYITKIKDRKLKEGIKIIPIPSDRSILFNDVLSKAIKKIPPFQKGKSDQGFKDTIILISIIEYFKENLEYSEIYLFSDDNGFTFVDCKKTGINLRIIKDVGIQKYLASKFKLKFELEKHLAEGSFIEEIHKIIDEKVLKNEAFISGLAENGQEISNYEVEKYTINEISDEECEVICFIIFDITRNNGEKGEKRIDITTIFKKDISGEWITTIPDDENE